MTFRSDLVRDQVSDVLKQPCRLKPRLPQPQDLLQNESAHPSVAGPPMSNQRPQLSRAAVQSAMRTASLTTSAQMKLFPAALRLHLLAVKDRPQQRGRLHQICSHLPRKSATSRHAHAKLNPPPLNHGRLSSVTSRAVRNGGASSHQMFQKDPGLAA